MASGRQRTFGAGRWVPLAATGILALVLFAMPAASVASPTSSTTHDSLAPAATSGLYAQATWNGANVRNYASATSAAHIGFNGVANVYYNWSSLGGVAGVGAPSFTINDARLQIFYFGFSLATRDVVDSAAVPATTGSFTMNWSTGALQYLLEGSYKLVASLLAPNGTTMWSQAFWVYVAAPFYVGAVLPIVLILIVIWELYNVATVGKYAMLGAPKSTAPPPSGEAPASEPPTATESPPPSEPETPTPPEEGSS